MAEIYGYVRVSTREQKEDRQLAALADVPVDRAHIYVDRASGRTFDRPAYRALLSCLCPGDLLVVQSIDRLGRNYKEILQQWQLLTREKRVDVQVLDMPLLNTRPSKDAMGVFVADLALQVLSYVAEAERENLKRRQAQGIAAAKARGIRFGRPGLPVPEQFDELKTQWHRGEISSRNVTLQLHISYKTFLRLVNSSPFEKRIVANPWRNGKQFNFP